MDNERDYREEIIQAIGRGYCMKENEGKQVDGDLCLAMAREVEQVVSAEKYISYELGFRAGLNESKKKIRKEVQRLVIEDQEEYKLALEGKKAYRGEAVEKIIDFVESLVVLSRD